MGLCLPWRRKARRRGREVRRRRYHYDDNATAKKKTDLSEAALGSDLGMTEEEYNAIEKSLVRKLDLTLVPMAWLLYLFNYLNRDNIA